MAKILLIETSTEVCSAAVSVDGRVVALAEDLECQSHAALLTLQISECTEAAGISLAQLDAVAVSQGPGAYTALRVGASVAKGICYALEKPLIAVDTLRALAHASAEFGIRNAESERANSAFRTPHSAFLLPMLDARRQEVWLAVYDADLREIAPAQPLILENNSFEKFVSEKIGDGKAERLVLSGNGIKKTRGGGISEKAVYSEIKKCSARYLALLAERCFQANDFQDIAYFEPFYMKPPNITSPTKPPF
ncbi:MAG: tRNA (adenosine(37)-N6)-threonylcarbamoyltransferase complex dimerization subunit type 1 TsaB [Saprospiraceae bacterium]